MYTMLLAATNGAFDVVSVDKIKTAEASLLRELKNKHPKIVEHIDTGAEPSDEDREAILKLAHHVSESYKPIEKEVKA
jgi:F0F1-type ATP synthase alpha subunit